MILEKYLYKSRGLDNYITKQFYRGKIFYEIWCEHGYVWGFEQVGIYPSLEKAISSLESYFDQIFSNGYRQDSKGIPDLSEEARLERVKSLPQAYWDWYVTPRF